MNIANEVTVYSKIKGMFQTSVSTLDALKEDKSMPLTESFFMK